MDSASVDQRMAEHLRWEGAARTTPRSIEVVSDDKSPLEKISVKKVAKKAAALSVAGAVAFGAVKGLQNAGAESTPNHPDSVRIENADGRQGAVKFVPWEMATAAQRHSALVESGAIKPEP